MASTLLEKSSKAAQDAPLRIEGILVPFDFADLLLPLGHQRAPSY